MLGSPGDSRRDDEEALGSIDLPSNIQHREDLDETLESIVRIYRQMVRHGVIAPDCDQDERPLIVDLNAKVEKGTKFRMLFQGRDAHHEGPR